MEARGSRATGSDDENSQPQPSSADKNHNPHSRLNPSANRVGDSVNKAVAQYTEDARLHAVFERTAGESGKTFDYTQSLRTTSESVPEQEISAYLSKMQRGGLIQPFGCTIAVDELDYRVIAYSENACEMLGLMPQSVPSLDRYEILTIGTDVRTLFKPLSSGMLERAFGAREITLLNPLWVHSKNSGKPFYAILHRIDVGIVIDLEPAWAHNPAFSIAGAVQSQKLAVRAISHLQSLPGGDIKLLCDAVVEQVRKLTGYDRVMFYRLHEDEHGEVVAESRRPDLEPYIGLHYPSTDIPQASRFLFKQNRVRMIMDCNAKPVKVIQDEALMQPLCLVGSTLRAPHGCHAQYMANMGSIASLTLAVVINRNEEDGLASRNLMRLWGLVVGHHTSVRCVPFPIRYACEFLMQAFALQLNMELQLASQLSEKRVLETQTMLCNLLLRDSLTGIVTQRPSIMDLVKCDGAALYHQGKYYPLGVAPSETQIHDIIQWLLKFHGDSAGVSTDSMCDASYPGAAILGDAVCGMAVAYITKRDYLFWFKSHTAKEIKWGGAKHHPMDKEDVSKMHPRTSFKAFLEVVKSRSSPWESAEIDAIHSLQLILRDSYLDGDGEKSKAVLVASGGREVDGYVVDELSLVAREMIRLIETATAPIFAVGIDGLVNGWNMKVAEMTGLSVEEAMGRSFVRDLVHEESEEIAGDLLANALRGEEQKNVELRLRTFGTEANKNAVFIVVNACLSKDCTDNMVGVCFVGQDVTNQKVVMDKFITIQGDYKAIVHNPSPLIPPIFVSDENTCCYEWNAAMEKLTGWRRDEIIGKMLIGEIFGNCCRLKGIDAMTKFMIVLHNAIVGQETEKFPFSFSDRNGKYVQVLLTANKRVNVDGQIVGAFCFLQITNPELRQALGVRDKMENCVSKMKELAYIIQQVRNPMSGIRFTNSALEALDLTEGQRQLLETSAACEKQVLRIMKDVDLDKIEDSSMELEKTDFLLGNLIDTIVSQAMLLLRERGLRLIHDIPEEVKTLLVYGDQVRIQQILADFLLSMVRYAPSPDGCVELQLMPSLKQVSAGPKIFHIEFRIVCPGEGLPPKLVQNIFHKSRWTSDEGLGLSMCRKILRLMNGEIQYIRESQGCYFRILLDLPKPPE